MGRTSASALCPSRYKARLNWENRILKALIILILFISYLYFAKIIDKADIKPYNEDIVFSILWEDTYVCISYLNKGEAIAEFIGFLNKEILITNKIQLDTCRNYYSGYNLKETECK